MADLKIGQVGCSGMGLRHLYGQIESKRVFGTFDYAAVCDLNVSAAEHVAVEAERGLGKRPNVYTNFDEMLDKESGLDAVDIVTNSETHHVLALKAFDAGVNVATEKPLAHSVRACRRMIEAAERSGKVLSVSENYRRDPLNRLARAVLDSGALGKRRLMMDILVWGTRVMPHTTAWRHQKVRGGYLLDYGVHDTDLLLFFMGDADRVYAETSIWEKERFSMKDPLGAHQVNYYRHRVKEEIELAETVETTSEDMNLAVIRFDSGAMGHLAMSIAAPGERTTADIVYCAEGSLRLSGSRSGRPVRVTMLDADEPLSEKDVLALVPDFELDDLTARIFDGSRRIWSYDMAFEQIDAKLIALELQDFAEAILNDRKPDVTGEVGLKAVALVYAILESGHLHQPVYFTDVVADRVNAYQQEINEAVGL